MSGVPVYVVYRQGHDDVQILGVALSQFALGKLIHALTERGIPFCEPGLDYVPVGEANTLRLDPIDGYCIVEENA